MVYQRQVSALGVIGSQAREACCGFDGRVGRQEAVIEKPGFAVGCTVADNLQCAFSEYVGEMALPLLQFSRALPQPRIQVGGPLPAAVFRGDCPGQLPLVVKAEKRVEALGQRQARLANFPGVPLADQVGAVAEIAQSLGQGGHFRWDLQAVLPETHPFSVSPGQYRYPTGCTGGVGVVPAEQYTFLGQCTQGRCSRG